ncbi:Uncharacterised protein [uncultured archaeon]|nr:Uncharacterised protein [uncultured archaeon]
MLQKINIQKEWIRKSEEYLKSEENSKIDLKRLVDEIYLQLLEDANLIFGRSPVCRSVNHCLISDNYVDFFSLSVPKPNGFLQEDLDILCSARSKPEAFYDLKRLLESKGLWDIEEDPMVKLMDFSESIGREVMYKLNTNNIDHMNARRDRNQMLLPIRISIVFGIMRNQLHFEIPSISDLSKIPSDSESMKSIFPEKMDDDFAKLEKEISSFSSLDINQPIVWTGFIKVFIAPTITLVISLIAPWMMIPMDQGTLATLIYNAMAQTPVITM